MTPLEHDGNMMEAMAVGGIVSSVKLQKGYADKKIPPEPPT